MGVDIGNNFPKKATWRVYQCGQCACIIDAFITMSRQKKQTKTIKLPVIYEVHSHVISYDQLYQIFRPACVSY